MTSGLELTPTVESTEPWIEEMRRRVKDDAENFSQDQDSVRVKLILLNRKVLKLSPELYHLAAM